MKTSEPVYHYLKIGPNQRRSFVGTPKRVGSPQPNIINALSPTNNQLRQDRGQSSFTKFSFREAFIDDARKEASLEKPLCTTKTCQALFNCKQQTQQLQQKLAYDVAIFGLIRDYSYQNIKKLEQEEQNYHTIEAINHLIYIHNLTIDALVTPQ